ncbi:hypothetical protein [uncultured Bradyrhizobium sp.]|uniref:hypothetical protein n=1 Tax=uncultured Bradyrhizobium sp. TaxID=199684 RepID=UPI0035CB4A1A
MADKIKSISARELSTAVPDAVKKALANNAAFKGIKAEPKFVMSPWLIGFILRELDMSRKTEDVQKLATEVAKSLPAFHGTPATLIRDNHIIMGYIMDKEMEFE